MSAGAGSHSNRNGRDGQKERSVTGSRAVCVGVTHLVINSIRSLPFRDFYGPIFFFLPPSFGLLG